MFTFEMFNLHTSCDERKPNIGICKNKDADHLCSNCTANQPSPFTSKIQNFKPPTSFCGRTAQFVSDLVETPEDMNSRVTALKTN